MTTLLLNGLLQALRYG